MTPAEITTLVRRRTGTNENTYEDADLLLDLNIYKDEIASKIQDVRPEIWNIPAVEDLVANQREYSFPSDVINNLVTVEVDLGDGFVLAKPIKRAPDMALVESKIVDHYDNENPVYFIRRNAIYILSGSIAAKTDGIRAVYNSFPADITSLVSTNDLSLDPDNISHGFPREFHELLVRRTSIGFKDDNDQALSSREQAYDVDLEKQLNSFSTSDQNIEEIRNTPSSESMGGHGYDY